MRLIHTPDRPDALFVVDGVTLRDGESAEVSEARGLELLARYPGNLTQGHTIATEETPGDSTSQSPHSPSVGTAPADTEE